MKYFSLNAILRLTVINFLIMLIGLNYLEKKIPETESGSLEKAPVKEVREKKVEAIQAVAGTLPQAQIKDAPLQKAQNHNTKSDCWIIYQGRVYNITSYFGSHPGGDTIMLNYCGKDATLAFDTKNMSSPSPHSQGAQSMLLQFLVE